MARAKEPAADLRLPSRRVLGGLLTRAERGAPAANLADGSRGHSWTVGITGPPGAGKSTVVDRLVTELRAGDALVAVLAVDPSSPLSGGALLGDRVRMASHTLDDGVLIRSLGNHGYGGGLSPAVDRCVEVLDLLGFDWILVETVGVGQIEMDVVSLADTTVVVLTPGWGDGVQANKAGLLELGDVVVVNKADAPGAAGVLSDLRESLGRSGVRPPVIATTAIAGTGIDEVAAAIRAERRDASPDDEPLRRRHRRHARMIDRAQEAFSAALASYVASPEGQSTIDGLLTDGHGAGVTLARAAVRGLRD